ncbi:GIY-YIG nuclease family protein [Methanobacterium sp.]|uniref:GIY-YIG nuclease family protein n=1 Tax=Methanobacterium sp. TaxID=2164 RepID=UPI003C779E8E
MATYCLIIQLIQNSRIKIGKSGEMDFKKGYYVYVGSALNSIDSRIKRHLSKEKKLFWHIDYFLNSPNSTVDEVILERSPEKWECNVALKISNKGTPIDRFGCSDCKCRSHLFYFKTIEAAKNACLDSFNELKLEIEKIKN